MASNRSIGRPSAAAIVAALFLPPLGVYLDRGVGPAFWLAAVLTMLFFVPGMVFALATVLGLGARRA